MKRKLNELERAPLDFVRSLSMQGLFGIPRSFDLGIVPEYLDLGLL